MSDRNDFPLSDEPTWSFAGLEDESAMDTRVSDDENDAPSSLEAEGNEEDISSALGPENNQVGAVPALHTNDDDQDLAYPAPPALNTGGQAAAAPQAAPAPANTTGNTQTGITRTRNEALNEAVNARASLPHVNISAVELLTFFPHHTQWPGVILRLKNRGWSTTDMAKISLFARGAGDRDDCKRRESSLRHQARKAGKAIFGDNWIETTPAGRQLLDNYTPSYDATNYTPMGGTHRAVSSTPTLEDLTKGVTNWPILGDDRGITTQVILWAVQGGVAGDYTVNDIPQLAAQQNFREPGILREGNIDMWDLQARDRMREQLSRQGFFV